VHIIENNGLILKLMNRLCLSLLAFTQLTYKIIAASPVCQFRNIGNY